MYEHKHFLFVLNLLLKPLNLQWSPTIGLQYKYELFYGDIGISITKDIRKVLEFIGVDPIYASSKQKYIMSEFIGILSTCKYTYLPSIFSKPNNMTSSMEDFYKKLTELVRLSASGQIRESMVIKSNFIPFRNRNKYIYLLDREFGKNGLFLKQIKAYDKFKTKANKIFIKNKFNGNLVMQWVPNLTTGKILSDTIKAFKAHVEIEERKNFNMYIKETNIRIIRIAFVSWYNKEIKFLDFEFNKLPF
jgi:hypothetical protein